MIALTKSKARNLLSLARCAPARMGNYFGVYKGYGAPIQFVVERADWAIRWVGESIRDHVNALSPNMMETIDKPQAVVRRVVHFGSQYMWSTWGHCMSKSNQYVTSFFHGKPQDGPEVAAHIARFMMHESRLSKIIVSNTIVEKRLLEWGVQERKLVRIPIGVDTTTFTLGTADQRFASRQCLDVPDNVILIGSFQKDGIGWGEGTSPKLIKGPDIFVKTMSVLRKKGLPVVALLTGPARGYVKQGLRDAGVPFVHKYVSSTKELAACYHALDVYLVTSREEGGPMSLMESMASGVPVISTNVGMAPDLITDGVSGGLVNFADAQELAQRVERILLSPESNNLRVNARAVVENVDWSIVSRDHWEKVYLPLIESNN